jgi:hypothetical protein
MSKVRGRLLEKDDDTDNSDLYVRVALSSQWAVTKSAPVPHNNSKTNKDKTSRKKALCYFIINIYF